MKILEEFKIFAIKGNAIDMAIGIIIGAAFGSIINSLVKDILTPVFARLLGNTDFTNLFLNLSEGSYSTLEEAKEAGAVTLNYGLFLNSAISFFLIAWTLFMFIKIMNTLRKKEPSKKITTKTCAQCFSKIHKNAKKCPYCTSEI